ncbi:MAG: hypothetical protein HC876_20245 [Chloroflexaceae bacterium]|nr:hypothetical protein [Chloroflexaceae bacterium]
MIHNGIIVSGLVYLRARWYDPASGTFLGRDPFEGFPDMPYSQHPYQYAYSNPGLWTDPSGMCVPFVEKDCLPVWEIDQGLNWQDGRDYVEVAIVEPVLGVVTTAEVVIDDPGIILRGAKHLVTNPIDSSLVIGQTAVTPFTDIYEGVTCGDPNQLGRGLTGFGMLLGGARLARTSRAAPIQRTAVVDAQVAQGLVVLVRARILRLAGFSERGIPLIVDESTVINVRGVTEALRNRGYNARSIQEIYGQRGIADSTIFDLAEAIDARVVTVDRGRDIGGGFGARSIMVDGRVGQSNTVIRIVETEIGTP